AGLRQLRIVAPERGPVVAERLLDGATLGRGATDLAECGLPQLAERAAGFERSLIGRPRPPRDRARQLRLDAEAPRVRRTREELGARVPRARSGQKLRRGLGVAMRELQQERQVVARVRLVGIADEHL